MTDTNFNPTDWFNLTRAEYLQLADMTRAEVAAVCSWMTNSERSTFAMNLFPLAQQCYAKDDFLPCVADDDSVAIVYI